MTGLDEALAGKEIPEAIQKSLALVTVPYLSFEGKAGEGHVIVHRELADEVRDIFKELFEMRFPIRQIVPVSAYDWDDAASMAANNTSAFNYRFISGTNRLSNHSYGRAIDINPVQNPYVSRDGAVQPLGASYDREEPGTVTAEVADIFRSRGWEWGGDWEQIKDWQHFEKA